MIKEKDEAFAKEKQQLWLELSESFQKVENIRSEFFLGCVLENIFVHVCEKAYVCMRVCSWAWGEMIYDVSIVFNPFTLKLKKYILPPF